MIVFDSVEEIQYWALETLLKDGELAQPRGETTRELVAVSLELRNPRQRCVTSRERRWSLPVAIGELAWHLAGSNQLSFIGYYLKQWYALADDPVEVRGSCYGHRIFSRRDSERSQWERLVHLLRVDPWSRRAVLDVYDPRPGLEPRTKDSPCACTLQFLIRSGRLHLLVYMRSNDVIWGLPYDIFVFTMLQELLASELQVSLGSYFHTVGSLHLYERQTKLAQRIVRAGTGPRFEMPAMASHRDVCRFLRLESRLRLGYELLREEASSLDEYWRDLLAVIDGYRVFKLQDSAKAALAVVPKDSPYRNLLENFWTDGTGEK